ncbi:helix-turn-helix transcriptional regulator [Bradyrhizobium sp. UFLA05-112]
MTRSCVTDPQIDVEICPPDNSRPRRMLNEAQVLAVVPVSTTTLWRMERRGLFPRGTFISANRKVWFEDEVVRWQREVDGRRRGFQATKGR